MTKEEQATKKKGDIVVAALDLFIERGYYGASTRQISQRAGISVGLMFHYFKDKDDLYCELIRLGTSKMSIPRVDEIEDADSCMLTFVTQLFEMIEGNPFFAKMFVFIDLAQHTKGIPEQGIEFLANTHVMEDCVHLIVKGQKDGQFREGDSSLLAMLFLCSIQGVAQEKVHRPHNGIPKAEWIMEMIRK